METHKKNSLLASLTETAMQMAIEDRRRFPFAFVKDGDPLFIENVATMLGCTVDQVRRIPRNQLPARQGPGKRLLYLRDDVVRYVQGQPVKGSDKPLRGHTGAVQSQDDPDVIPFDPAAKAKQLQDSGSW